MEWKWGYLKVGIWLSIPLIWVNLGKGTPQRSFWKSFNVSQSRGSPTSQNVALKNKEVPKRKASSGNKNQRAETVPKGISWVVQLTMPSKCHSLLQSCYHCLKLAWIGALTEEAELVWETVIPGSTKGVSFPLSSLALALSNFMEGKARAIGERWVMARATREKWVNRCVPAIFRHTPSVCAALKPVILERNKWFRQGRGGKCLSQTYRGLNFSVWGW